jgi:hypothetical protein
MESVWKTGCRARQKIWYGNSFQTVLYAKLLESGSGTPFGRLLARNEKSFLNQFICDTVQARSVTSPIS